jgi:L-iditol 2-dehydrogenase
VQCATWRATKIDPGGIAQYFRVPPENQRDTLLLPPALAFKDAALIEPLACTVKSVRRSGLKAGDRLYVLGLGVMGLMHALLGLARGAHVFGGDLVESRRDFAESIGVTAIDPVDVPKRLESGADIVICCPGSAGAMTAACEAAAPGGTVVMFTPLPAQTLVRIDWERFYFKDLNLVASYSCGPDDTRGALDSVERGVVSAEKVGADLITLDDVPRAYRELAEARIVKPIVCF